MEKPNQSGTTAQPVQSDLARCRIAAWGGVCGAVMVPGALLALYYLLQADEPVGEVPVVVALVGMVTGIVLMLVAMRVAGRGAAGGPSSDRRRLRLVSAKPPRQSAA